MAGVSGRRALVTGAGNAGGIGFAIALALAAAGARVAITSTTARIFERRDTLSAFGSGHLAFVGDLTDAEQAQAVLAQVRATMGGVDILINNAGLSQLGRAEKPERIEAMADDKWHHDLAINLSTTFNMTRAVLPCMQHSRYGRIVNVASVTGPIVTIARTAGYSAAKAGMVGLTRATAIENADRGITCNAVLPGWIATDSAGAMSNKAGKATPASRPGTPAEVAAACVFLASDEASYITGTSLVVDGGHTIVEMKGARSGPPQFA